jgi:hypothetical protein
VRGSDFIKLYRSLPKKEIEIIFFTLLIMTTYLVVFGNNFGKMEVTLYIDGVAYKN